MLSSGAPVDATIAAAGDFAEAGGRIDARHDDFDRAHALFPLDRRMTERAVPHALDALPVEIGVADAVRVAVVEGARRGGGRGTALTLQRLGERAREIARGGQRIVAVAGARPSRAEAFVW